MRMNIAGCQLKLILDQPAATVAVRNLDNYVGVKVLIHTTGDGEVKRTIPPGQTARLDVATMGDFELGELIDHVMIRPADSSYPYAPSVEVLTGSDARCVSEDSTSPAPA